MSESTTPCRNGGASRFELDSAILIEMKQASGDNSVNTEGLVVFVLAELHGTVHTGQGSQVG